MMAFEEDARDSEKSYNRERGVNRRPVTYTVGKSFMGDWWYAADAWKKVVVKTFDTEAAAKAWVASKGV